MVSGVVTEREQWERERLLESLEAYRAGMADAPFVQKYAVNVGGLPNPDRPLTFVASDEREDRMGDVIRAEGWDLYAYRRNPVFLWAHDHTRTPIGRSTWVDVDAGRLLATVEFAPTDFAQEVETLYRGRFLRAVSVGFRPQAFTFRKGEHGKVTGVEYTSQELLEISAVAVPANPHALARALDSGLSVPRLRPVLLPGPAFTAPAAAASASALAVPAAAPKQPREPGAVAPSPERSPRTPAPPDHAAARARQDAAAQADAIIAALRELRQALAG